MTKIIEICGAWFKNETLILFEAKEGTRYINVVSSFNTLKTDQYKNYSLEESEELQKD